jgi:hypothetical protein
MVRKKLNTNNTQRKELKISAPLSIAHSQSDPPAQTRIERKKLLLPEQTQIIFCLGSPSPLAKFYYESDGAFVLYMPKSRSDAEPPNTITALIPSWMGWRLPRSSPDSHARSVIMADQAGSKSLARPDDRAVPR